MAADGKYGKRLEALNKDWKKGLREGTGGQGSKHAKIAQVVLEFIFEDPALSGEEKGKMQAVLGGVDVGKEGELEALISVMKWKGLKSGREGVLEFKMVAELWEIEGIMVRVLSATGGKVLTTPEPRQPQIREVDELISDTWRR